jgi:hypothetical protein
MGDVVGIGQPHPPSRTDVTAGVEAALAADRRYWARRLRTHLRELPSTARSQRDLLTALAEEFYAAADDIDHGAGQEPNHV